MVFINTKFQLPFYLLLLICLCNSLGYSQDQRKKALLIGVGKYPESGGWNSLSSGNDIDLVTKALINQGFKPENITTLTDEKAVKKNILQVLRVDFLKKVNKGDIVYFQYSGHGQQAADLSGDEVDGLDECLVPYDSPMKFKPGVYEGENLITDDELGQALAAIRTKLGPEGHAVVVLDACHSGTGTRGTAQARGTTEIMASKDFLNAHKGKIVSKEDNSLSNKSRGAQPEAPIAPMISFFGSAQNQLNYEMTDDAGTQYGSLSYAFTSALLKTGSSSSYRSLFDRIRREMSQIAPLQQPQIEGDLDIDVFNGKLLGKVNYYRTLKIFSDTEFSMNGGTLHGINTGAIVGLFPPDTRDFENTKPLATGTVSKAYPTSSNISLEQALDKEQLESAWISVLENSFGELKVNVGIISDHVEWKSQIEPWLYAKPYIVKEEQNAKLWFFKELKSSDEWLILKTSDGYRLDSIKLSADLPISKSTANKFLRKIRSYLQGMFIKKMDMEAPDIKVSFKLVRVDDIESGMTVENIPTIQNDPGGVKRIAVGTQIQILVHNEGIKPAFFTLLDLQPDNMINPLLPDDHTTAEELRILPGQKILLSNRWVIGEPYGQEMFKLISSSKPIDLKSTLGTRGFSEKSPFEKLFLETKDEETFQTRGGKAISLPASDLNIYTDTFTIIK